ncbi:unnamed protein product [Larinioides sclopetarius]|uniref:NADH dehydrogenase subunit 6 n=1 Tax=Larinioides sclopetarius TaxID=280406 RepID=A0AAV2BZ77_9ARAC
MHIIKTGKAMMTGFQPLSVKITTFIGFFLYMTCLCMIITEPWNVSSLLVSSISVFIIGVHVACVFEKNENFLTAFGLSMFLIGIAYQLKYLWTICYNSCIFGGFLTIEGHILMNLKLKPNAHVIMLCSFLGFVSLTYGCSAIITDSLSEMPTLFMNKPVVPNAWINICIGIFSILNADILKRML